MKIIFMGTPEFAVPCLNELVKNNYNIAAVISQPDKPKGRGHKLMSTPVKVKAEEYGLPIIQPRSVKDLDFIQSIKEMNPDMIIVVAFGQILPKAILDIPKFGCINVHASLLPKYRGAAPINWSIIKGEKNTGVTTMHMDIGLDTGDMILKKEIPIEEQDDAQSLHDKLSRLGANLLIDTIKMIENDNAPKIKQVDSESSYAPMLFKTLGRIDWSNDSITIKNLIRGVIPWPGAYSQYSDKIFKIMNAEAIEDEYENKKPGLIYKVCNDYFLVQCGKGSLKINEIQFENEKRMSVDAYLKGHKIQEGIILL